MAEKKAFRQRGHLESFLSRTFLCLIFFVTFTYDFAYGETGSIYITSNPPGAEISLDGNPIQVKTDMIISDVITGPHKISVELPGYGKAEKMIEVKDGLTTDVHFNLQPGEAPTQVREATDASTYHTTGFSYFDKGEYDLAIADFSKAINLDPGFLLAYYNRGVAYFDKDEFDRAIADFSKAMELGFKGKGAYHIRGVAYGKKGQYDLAVADFSKALEIDPRDATLYNNRGIIHLMVGQYKQTVADLTKAIELDSKNSAEYYFHLAYVLYRMGETEKAQENFSRAREIDKDIVAKRAEFFQKSTNPKIKRLYAEELLSASNFLEVQTHILAKAKDMLGEAVGEPITSLPFPPPAKKSFFDTVNPWLILVIILLFFGIVLGILGYKAFSKQKKRTP